MGKAAHQSRSFALLVTPAVAIYGAVVMAPILYSLVLSFTRWSGIGTPQFVGFENFITIFKDPVFRHGLRNNIAVVGISVFGQIPAGFILAYILHRKMVRGGRFFEAMIFLPIVLSPIIVAILFGQFFSPSGMFTALMRGITGNPQYILTIFENKQLAIVPILAVLLWMYTGLYMIIFLAALQGLDPALIEAALLDGASEGQVLTRIVFPALRNTVFATSVFAIAGSLKGFDLIWAMTNGGPAHYTEVVSIYMYINTFQHYKYGFGSAVSVIIVLLSVGLISILRWLFQKLEERESRI